MLDSEDHPRVCVSGNPPFAVGSLTREYMPPRRSHTQQIPLPVIDTTSARAAVGHAPSVTPSASRSSRSLADAVAVNSRRSVAFTTARHSVVTTGSDTPQDDHTSKDHSTGDAGNPTGDWNSAADWSPAGAVPTIAEPTDAPRVFAGLGGVWPRRPN